MKSTHRLPSTPKAWEFVNIRSMENGKYALTISEHDCFVGREEYKAAGIARPYHLTFGQALRFGTVLDAWLKKKGREQMNKSRQIVSEDDYVPSEWCEGAKMTVGEWGQREWNSGVKTGKRNGYEHAALLIAEKAAKYFMIGRDEDAKFLREVSAEIKKQTETP